MNYWIYKTNTDCADDQINNFINHEEEIVEDDILYGYIQDHEQGNLRIVCKHIVKNGEAEAVTDFSSVETDLPYSVLYKTNTQRKPHKLSDEEYMFIMKKNQIPYTETAKSKLYSFSDDDSIGALSFKHSNILFKGVPGTGKSRIIYKIIEKKLELDKEKKEHKKNILHINIHSASSNADLMQGIGISTTSNDQVAYKEKQGLIYDFIRRACYAPKQPFALILEEIQENSLNELIGDLIYLIEPSKRLKISMLSDVVADNTKIAYTEKNGLVSKYIEKSQEKYNSGDKSFEVHSVNIPYLVSTSTEYRTMILPDNLFVFCTSNYRDDKKVIEDNLLRRFDVIELYPQYKDGYKNPETAVFLESLNHAILDVFHEEIHPDRFQIGHANWLKIEKDDTNTFYESLLKVVIDFKEIKEIESSRLLKVFNKTLETLKKITDEKENPSWLIKPFEEAIEAFGKEPSSYAKLVDFLQQKSYSDLLTLSETS